MRQNNTDESNKTKTKNKNFLKLMVAYITRSYGLFMDCLITSLAWNSRVEAVFSVQETYCLGGN